MFRSITQGIPKDKDFTDRVYNMTLLNRMLDGTIYDHLLYDFHYEYSPSGEFVHLRDRAPSVRWNGCRIVVEDSVNFLFGEGRFPSVDSLDGPTREALTNVIKNCHLQQVMIDAAMQGSVGSVAVLMRVLRNSDGENRIYFQPLSTQYLTPVYDPNAPDTLLKITEKYKLKGSDLADVGYDIPLDNYRLDYWVQRVFDQDAETHFQPMLVADAKDTNGKQKKMIEDADKQVKHNLGFVPIVWIKNLPGGKGNDGACTFGQMIHTQIQIEYQLSQIGRALGYSADPVLLIKDNGGPDGTGARLDGTNTLFMGENGDAKHLEINGNAAESQLNYVRGLRELALEAVHGNRSSIDKLSLPQSGIALKILFQPLIALADVLRGSYGECGLKNLLKMVLRAQAKLKNLQAGDVVLPKLDAKTPISLRWNDYFAPTDTDNVQQANAINQLVAGGSMSRETSVKAISGRYDIENVSQEIRKIESEEAKRQTEDQALAAVDAKKNIIPHQ